MSLDSGILQTMTGATATRATVRWKMRCATSRGQLGLCLKEVEWDTRFWPLAARHARGRKASTATAGQGWMAGSGIIQVWDQGYGSDQSMA